MDLPIDWSEAPHWATKVIRLSTGPEYCWANEHSLQHCSRNPVSKVFTFNRTIAEVLGEFTVLELRPEPKKQPATPSNSVATAPDFLRAAMKHQEDRAATYDSPDGERSMAKTVEAFNAITGHKLTEEEGWLFMGILKQVRSLQGAYKADTFEDEAGYAALRGECAARTRG